MRDYRLFSSIDGARFVSDLPETKIHELLNKPPRNRGLNGCSIDDFLERLRIELVIRGLPA